MNDEWINTDLATLYAHFGERFSREQCLADLRLLSHQGEMVLNIRGNEVRVKKGQVAISIRTLCKRWGLASMTVRRLLRSFQHENLIKINTSSAINIIDVLIPISTQTSTQTSTQKVDITNCDTNNYKTCSTQTSTQTSTQNEKSENLTKIPRAPAIDSIYNIKQDNNIVVDVNACVRERSCVSADMSAQERAKEDAFVGELKRAPIWQEQMCMRHKITPSELDAWIETFSLDAECRGTLHDNLTQVKRHFNDWLRIQIREQRKINNENNRPNTKDRRRGFEVSACDPADYTTTF
ncbi:hypothetical protein [Hoylesella shahii]|uniref:DUF7833 domain-containing protein n=1 Tax=Hoylesella shahii TaxID=228603 RepID=UPI0028E77627|nr:hypothetical protein [Hoylesella shahii]